MWLQLDRQVIVEWTLDLSPHWQHNKINAPRGQRVPHLFTQSCPAWGHVNNSRENKKSTTRIPIVFSITCCKKSLFSRCDPAGAISHLLLIRYPSPIINRFGGFPCANYSLLQLCRLQGRPAYREYNYAIYYFLFTLHYNLFYFKMLKYVKNTIYKIFPG